ncbi:MAG: benzoyl-CoA reductase subunit D [Planctomycetota bacterium]|jgi:benzoyl-CoA reductase subunit D
MHAADGSPLRVAGIDVGSSAAKLVLLEDTGDGRGRILLGTRERIRRRDPRAVTEGMYASALAEAGLQPEDLAYVATTGEGELVPFRTGHFYGMTAHARGAIRLAPEARVLIDIGALHARAVVMDERSKVLGYRMTSQCASGSGQFLENICRYLGITIDEIGPLSLQADAPEQCSSICAVLAETDVINMVSRGITTANIIKGIHQSMAGRYLKLLTSLNARGAILVTGGLASDVGLMAALREGAQEQELDVEIIAHEQSVLAGALGAALWGAYRHRKLSEKGIALVPGAPPAGAPVGART